MYGSIVFSVCNKVHYIIFSVLLTKIIYITNLDIHMLYQFSCLLNFILEEYFVNFSRI